MPDKKVLVVDDEKLIRWSLKEKITDWKMEVMEAEDGSMALRLTEEETPDLIILDVNLPDFRGTELLKKLKKNWPEIPVVMITAYGSIDDAVTAMRNGAYDFITKPINDLKLQSTLNRALEAAALKRKIAYYEEKDQRQFDPKNIVAESDAMRKIMEMTKIIAQSETIIVLLQGGSGTGKDLLAQAIHHLSRRKSASYLAINCSTIPENLLESELFGYEKGAFTDAKQQKKGLVELANGGTLFLDEISTLGLPLQAKLLRFLETQTFKRVGGLRDIEVDIRVIAATNQDLDVAVQDGKFRNDLYFRLNVCPIFIPSLRDRIEDILPLAKNFVREFNPKFRKNIKGLNKKAEKVFLDYEWPGNVRELKNAVERAMIFETGSFISLQYLPFSLNSGLPSPPAPIHGQANKSIMALDEMERDLIEKALANVRGNKSQAARTLGISRDTLRYKLKKWNIPTG